MLTDTQGARFTWLDDNRILMLDFGSVKSSVEEMDKALDGLQKAMDSWPTDKPYLCLICADKLATTMWTPVSRQKSEVLMGKLPKHLHGRVAVVLKNNPIAFILRFFIERIANRRLRTIQNRVFFNRDEALEWLRERL